jgi:predicted transcriptional regulator
LFFSKKNVKLFIILNLNFFKMVKSFQGVRQVNTERIPTQQITVGEFMTKKLITFHPDEPIDYVCRALVEYNISGGPVIDDDCQLVGVISEGDCLKEIVRGKYNNMPNPSGKVSDYMAKDIKTIRPETNVLEAAKMFLNLKVRRFPVINTEGKLVGQVSQRDIIKAVQNLKQETWCQK